jgi:hypothetical protein
MVETARCVICLRSGEWPQRLHDVEELDKLILDEARGQAPGRGDRVMFLSDPAIGVAMLVIFIACLMLGFPIAFTLMALGVGFGYYAMGNNIFQLFVQRTYSVMANDVLISIPLFLFMGYVVERANILDRLFRSIQLAAGWIPGSLAVATLITCAMFATATGTWGAVVTLMGPSPSRPCCGRATTRRSPRA